MRKWLKSEEGVNLSGFVVIDDNFEMLFRKSLPDGHFVKTYFESTICPFNPLKEGLTEAKGREAFDCLMVPYN